MVYLKGRQTTMKKLFALLVVTVLALTPIMTVLTASAADMNDSVTNYITKTLKATHYYNFKDVGDYNADFANGKADLAAKSKAFLNLATGKYDAVLRNGVRVAAGTTLGPVVVADFQGNTGSTPFATGGKRTNVPVLTLQNKVGAGASANLTTSTMDKFNIEILSEVFNKNVLDNNTISVSLWVKYETRDAEPNSPRLFAFGMENTNTLFASVNGVNYPGRVAPDRRIFAAAKDAANGTADNRPHTSVNSEPDVWYHIVYILNGKAAANNQRLQLYVNGVNIPAPGNTTTEIKNLYDAAKTYYHIGIGNNESASDFDGATYTPPINGQIADFAIYDYALTAAQVTTLYGIMLNGDPSFTGGGTTPTTTRPTGGGGTTNPTTGDMSVMLLVAALLGSGLLVYRLRKA